MRALLLDQPGAVPRLAQIASPDPRTGSEIVTVSAAALTNLDIAVAEGRHYLSPPSWPRGIGREAVAVTGAGQRVFLNAAAVVSPYGSLAEQVLADCSATLPVPDHVPDALAAALGNAGLAAWLSLSWRGRLSAGETVLVLGATGASGSIAVAAAKALGSGRVVAAGRNPAKLGRLLERGADAIIRLGSDEEVAASLSRSVPDGVDVVIDFLNGPPAQAALGVMRRHGRMVQIGSTLGSATPINAQIARRGSLDVLGFAYYHAPIEQQAAALSQLCEAALSGLVEIDYRVVRLDSAAEAWAAQKAGAGIRWVVTP